MTNFASYYNTFCYHLTSIKTESGYQKNDKYIYTILLYSCYTTASRCFLICDYIIIGKDLLLEYGFYSKKIYASLSASTFTLVVQYIMMLSDNLIVGNLMTRGTFFLSTRTSLCLGIPFVFLVFFICIFLVFVADTIILEMHLLCM